MPLYKFLHNLLVQIANKMGLHIKKNFGCHNRQSLNTLHSNTQNIQIYVCTSKLHLLATVTVVISCITVSHGLNLFLLQICHGNGLILKFSMLSVQYQ
jgi:hypothetical protein